MTADQETQAVNTVALWADPSVVFAGTGWGIFFAGYIQATPSGSGEFGRGILRSTNAGAAGSWCRIGPAWPIGTANDASPLVVFNIVRDSLLQRVYAATDKGLFYSTNAHSAACSSVQWTHLSQPTNPTGIPQVGGQPAQVRNVLVSLNSNLRLYAGTKNTFYRSDDGGASWTLINTGLPSTNLRPSAAITRWSGGRDVIYVPGGAASACPGAFGPSDVYQGVSPGNCPSCTTWAPLRDPTDPLNPCQPPFSAEHGIRSVAVHPTDSNVIVVGADAVYLSTDNASTFSNLTAGGPEGVHPDQNDLKFGLGTPASLYTSNDGGIWRRDSYTQSPWINLNNGISNILFYRGTIDNLNQSVSWGGTQDNGDMKGPNAGGWRCVQGGDGTTNLVDWAESNIAYFINARSTNGGLGGEDITQGLPQTRSFRTLSMDGSNSKTLVIWGVDELFRPQFYRRLFNLDAAWHSITGSNAPPGGVPNILYPPVFAPSQALGNPSNVIFAGDTHGKVWRTVNANAPLTSTSPAWTQLASTVLPDRPITSLAVVSSSCTDATYLSCVIFASVSGFDTDHVYRSTDGGSTWQSVSGTLPNVPVTRVVVHPFDSKVLWVATDLGVFQGCTSFNGATCDSSASTWYWGTFNTNLPAGTFVKDLAIHKESGLLRAFAFGNSAWEVRAFTPPRAEQPVNVHSPSDYNQNATADVPRLSSGKSGQKYAVTWMDDRTGVNNWHTYFQGFGYDVNSNIVTVGGNIRVDDLSPTHVVQNPSSTVPPTNATDPVCARVVWQDTRLNPNANPPTYNSYLQYVCSDGTKQFPTDLQADQTPAGFSATLPTVAAQPSFDFAVAWADDQNGNGKHDVYTRFFYGLSGSQKGNAKRVSNGLPSLDATQPAAAADASNNVFIVYAESGMIRIAKYGPSGTCLKGAGSGCPANPPAALNLGTHPASYPSVSVDDAGKVVVAWREQWSSSPTKVVATRCSNSLGTCNFIYAPCMNRCVGGTLNQMACTTNADCPGGGQCSRLNCYGGVDHGKACAMIGNCGSGALACLASRCAGGNSIGLVCMADVDCPGSICDSATPRVSCPALAPLGGQSASYPSVVTDSPTYPTPAAGNPIVSWESNENDPANVTRSGFGRSFTSALAPLVNDFRVDLAGRTVDVQAPRVARSPFPSRYVTAWRDNRAGSRYDLFTRFVMGNPQSPN